MGRRLAGAAAAAALSGAAGCGAADAVPRSHGPAHPLLGRPAPELTAEKVMGEGPTTLREAAGKVVIVDFWATYCTPCKTSFSRYQELLGERGPGLAVIAVSVDDHEDATAEQIQGFVRGTSATFAILWDRDKSAFGLYAPPKMPSAFLVDGTGVVRHLLAGYESGDELQLVEEIEALR